jgi:hypothetical protein
MINLGLSSADLRLYQASLISGHQMAITLQVLDLNHNKISDISDMLLDGQVNKSYWEWITSGATLTLRDPDGLTGFDTLSPSDGALYADRMIRITYSVWSELLPRWVHCPIFTGPVTKVSRDDTLLSVECQGKESLYMAPTMSWTTGTYRKGTKLSDSTGACAIRDALGTKGGETHFDLPEWGTTLSKDWPLTTETPLWWIVLHMAGTRHRTQLFYDGRGVVRLRARSPHPVLTFTENHLTSVPKLDYDTERLRNAVLVKGGMIGTRQIISIRHLPKAHGASSYSLRIGTRNRPLVEVVEDSNLTTQAAADDVAENTLASVEIGSTGFDFDALPQPHLEPGDTVALSTRDTSLNLLADKFSIPIQTGDNKSMSMGDNRRISANVRRLRRR